MKLILLSQQYNNKYAHLKISAIVDDEDFEYLNQFNWTATKTGNTTYAKRTEIIKGKKRTVMMHRVIMGCKHGDGKMIDHRDRNGLNCQKHNLRFCTNSQNQANAPSQGSTSKYRGVHFYIRKEKIKGKIYSYPVWIAILFKDSKKVLMKRFKTEVEAALAYNEAAIKYHGEFARLNAITQPVELASVVLVQEPSAQ